MVALLVLRSCNGYGFPNKYLPVRLAIAAHLDNWLKVAAIHAARKEYQMWLYEGIAYPVVRSGKFMGTGRDLVLVKTPEDAQLYKSWASLHRESGHRTEWVRADVGQLVCPD
jgi:hypothetical protein